MKGYPTKTPERVAEAQRMRADGALLREIALHFGIAKNTAWQWITDPDGSEMNTRRQIYDGKCAECGARVHASTVNAQGAYALCVACFAESRRIWTRDAIILAIQDWADEHGGIPPAANDWYRAKAAHDIRIPAVTQVVKIFGKWSDGIRAAGFEPHTSGPIGGFTALTLEQREECARRYAAGEPSTVIAADLGCSPQVVTKWARRAGVKIRPVWGRKVAA